MTSEMQEAALKASKINAPDLNRLMDVKVVVSCELGRRRISIAEVLHLLPNTTLDLFKRADEPLDICVNGRLIARGEAVVMGDRYGIRITEVVYGQASEHINESQINEIVGNLNVQPTTTTLFSPPTSAPEQQTVGEPPPSDTPEVPEVSEAPADLNLSTEKSPS